MELTVEHSDGDGIAFGQCSIHLCVAAAHLVDDVVGRVFDDDVVEVAGLTVRVEALLAHLLAHIHARTVRVLDGVPDEVMVVLTAGGPEVPIYSAASIRARIGEVTMVEETRAWSALAAHGPGDVDPDQAGVLGALAIVIAILIVLNAQDRQDRTPSGDETSQTTPAESPAAAPGRFGDHGFQGYRVSRPLDDVEPPTSMLDASEQMLR